MNYKLKRKGCLKKLKPCKHTGQDGMTLYIWSILPRSNPPLKNAGDIPQIVSNRITRMKPINVGFVSLFLAQACSMQRVSGRLLSMM